VRLNEDNNEQLIESNQPLEANNNNCDKWPKIITLSLLPFFLFVPYFEILKTNSEQEIRKKIFYIQGFFGFISSIVLIGCMLYMLEYLIDSVQKWRYRWIALTIAIISIVLLIFLIKFWFWREDLRKLILDHQIDSDIAVETESKSRLFFRLSAMVFLILFIYYTDFTITTIILNNSNTTRVATPFRLTVWLPIHSQYLFVEIFYITICWMICARFRHLNDTIKDMKQIPLFNEIFSLPMACFFFTHIFILIIGIEDMIYNYDKQPISVIVCNVVFDSYRILTLIYLVKQTSDITREASKTPKFLNQYRFSGCNEENQEFKKEVMN
jgi:MFS family permease